MTPSNIESVLVGGAPITAKDREQGQDACPSICRHFFLQKLAKTQTVIYNNKGGGKEMNDKICKAAAQVYANRDWHKLSEKEQDLVKLLEKNGYIIPNNPVNGFVGKAA